MNRITTTGLAVLASGRGSNLKALLENIENGNLRNAQIILVISNNSRAGALELARAHGIDTAHISGLTHPQPDEYAGAFLKILAGRGIELILLAGYMKLLPEPVIKAYPNRILNIHPALLPKFGGQGMHGLNVHRAVLEAGERESGVTIHYVNSRYDEGTIIRQVSVPVLTGDTPQSLASRVLAAEHNLYWRVVDAIVNAE